MNLGIKVSKPEIWNAWKSVRLNFWKILTAYFFMIWSTSFESFTISTRNSIMDDATYKIRVKLLHLLTPKTDKSSTFSKILNYSWKLFWIVALSKFGGKVFWAGNSKICYQNTEKFYQNKKSISKNSSNWSDIQILHTKRVQIFRLVNFISFYEFCKKITLLNELSNVNSVMFRVIFLLRSSKKQIVNFGHIWSISGQTYQNKLWHSITFVTIFR